MPPPTPHPPPARRNAWPVAHISPDKKGFKGLLVFKTVEDAHTQRLAHEHINEQDGVFSLGQE